MADLGLEREMAVPVEARPWSSVGHLAGQGIYDVLSAGTPSAARAVDPSGAAREFVGWVGLVAAIDALVRGGAPAEALDVEFEDLPSAVRPTG